MNPRFASLWYSQPAARWEEALPIGNGRLGAMVWGGADREILDLNEENLWAGTPRDPVNYEAARHLAEVRRLLAEGRAFEAQQIVERRMLGPRIEAYQPLGRLNISRLNPAAPAPFARGLDLATASAWAPGRRVWASAPDGVVVAEWDQAGDFDLAWDCPHPHRLEQAGDDLRLTGRCPVHVADNWHGDHPWPVTYEADQGVKFAARVRVVAPGATVTVTSDGRVTVKGASKLVVLLSAFGSLDDPDPVVARTLAQAARRTPGALWSRHLKDHRSYWNRFALTLGPVPSTAKTLDTAQRLAAVQAGADDPGLVALYALYGRYLLLACSRPGTRAATLQGLWNPHVNPPWGCDYTVNINTQMNYLSAEAANLAECHEPLVSLMDQLAVTGARVARHHYGASGWCAHHNVDGWGTATPSDGDARWAFWPLGGVWLATHLMEIWRFGRDDRWLADRGWPLLAGAAAFALDWLVEAPDGSLTTSPSTSPENVWRDPEGREVALTTGSAMDRALIRHLLNDLVEAAAVLGRSEPLVDRARAALPRIAGPLIAPNGTLLEWGADVPEVEVGHRHFSHLWPLHPGTEIRPGTPEATAARATLERRLAHGGAHTGWSAAWLINLWARLGDAPKAGAAVGQVLRKSTLPNLFDDHPPFQIDGNFGALAGLLEMLCQSHEGVLSLWPAWPRRWNRGEVKGLRARGGFVVDLSWHPRQGRRITVRATKAGLCRVTWPGGQAERQLAEGEVWALL